jgi:hypothetical protein
MRMNLKVGKRSLYGPMPGEQLGGHNGHGPQNSALTRKSR